MKSGGPGSDEEIAAHAKAGDRNAFEILVRRHKESLYRFVRRYVGQSDDAYDVLQDCFVSAWFGLRRYDPARPFLPWLRTIALNKCRDFSRRRTVRQLVLQAFARETTEPHSIPAPDLNEGGETELTERLARLNNAVVALPAFYKEPLLLTMVSGLSHQEVAKMLRTTPKAIEMRLYRARKKIVAAISLERVKG